MAAIALRAHVPLQIHADPLLQVRALNVQFSGKRGTVQAVGGVSFDLQEGERLAIVGESGSGKSVTALALMQLLPFPGRVTGGSARFAGQDLLALKGADLQAARGASLTMAFQDPMSALNPVLRISEQMLPPLRRHTGMGAGEARQRAIDVLSRTGIPDAERILGGYPHQLSGGMRQRVLLSMALACNPRLLIADEPTTALDVTVQAQIVSLLKEISEQQDMAIIFITHDMGLVARFAHRVAVMYAGRIVETGPTGKVFANPRHPYTQALLASIPPIAGARSRRLFQIDGSPPDLSKPTRGCAFAPRCRMGTERCMSQRPMLESWDHDHAASCLENSPLEHVLSLEAMANAV
jgi:oligopeptide/dipeptide ABC transporter ATP-binding protein